MLGMASSFEPDEPIQAIQVQLHTAAVSDASTDSDIFIELFDWPPGFEPLKNVVGAFAVEIDTSGFNDFEAGGTKTYSLPTHYFSGRIVNELQRLCIHKGDDAGTDWGFGWVSVRVNNKPYYTKPSMATSPDSPTWLSDGEKWCAPNFPRVDFEAPVIEGLGLPDGSSDEAYSVDLTAHGGRKPLTWKILSASGTAFTAAPTLATLNAEGTQARFSAHTISTKTVQKWAGTVHVRDADGRQSERAFTMRVVFSLPAPTVASMEPTFGWPTTTAEASAVVVTLTSAGDDYDSRKPGATRVFFTGTTGSVEGQIVEITSSALDVRVPIGAVPGPLTIQTDFGKAATPHFVAHPSGYRFIKGFSFVNQTKDGDNSDGFPDTFDWLRFEQAFGLDEMWMVVFDQAVMPNPIATFFYITAHDTLDNGCCHGFALTSLQMAKGIIPTSAFDTDALPYPLDDALWEMTGPSRPSLGLSDWIQGRQLVVFSDEALSYYLEKIDSIPNTEGALCQMDARPALTDVEMAIGSGLSNPRMLAFSADCLPWRGHVVVPYGVEQGDGVKTIRVYNPNKPARQENPDDGGSYIWVKPQSGEWGHTWSDGELWNGLYMFTIPLTEYGHQTDWSMPGLGSLMDLVGTFILGCAGTDAAAEITQVTDEAGSTLFDEQGRVRADRSTWPVGARPVPIMGRGGTGRPLIALSEPMPLQFTVRASKRGPKGGPVRTSGLFSLTRGSDRAMSIEEIDATLSVRFDPADDSVELAPMSGTASGIVRFSQRFPENAESLSYALRLHGLEAGSPIRIRPTSDRRAVALSAGGHPLTADVEVIHTSRTGRQRILESDRIAVPAGSVTDFRVTHPETIEQPGALPLTVDIDSDGQGISVTRQILGSRQMGPMVVAPQRVVARPRITIASTSTGTTREVAVDVSGSTSASPGETLRYRVLGRSSREADGSVIVSVPPGTRPVRIVAEDTEGRRSFPRTVFVTVPRAGDRVVPLITAYGTDVTIPAGATGSVGFGTYVLDEPTIGVTLDLSIRDRISGQGPDHAELLDDGFALSPDIAVSGGRVSTHAVLGGLNLKVSIAWDAGQPRTGEIDLGHLSVHVSPGVPLGSAFVLRGVGTATIVSHDKVVERPLNVLPSVVRAWGGPEPAMLSVEGGGQVGEGKEAMIRALPQGMTRATNVGWWIEKISGVASIRQDPADPTRATVAGRRAGFVRVKVVVGTTTAEHLIRVTPTVAPTRVGLGSILRTAGRPSRRRLGKPLTVSPIVPVPPDE